MPDESLSALVQRIVRATVDHGGSTADLLRMRLLPAEDAWYFPRFPELTMIVVLADLSGSLHRFIDRHRDVLIEENLYLGTWINPETRACYLDLITHHGDQVEALALARRQSDHGGRRIVAICNPKRGLTRYVWEEPF